MSVSVHLVDGTVTVTEMDWDIGVSVDFRSCDSNQEKTEDRIDLTPPTGSLPNLLPAGARQREGLELSDRRGAGEQEAGRGPRQAVGARRPGHALLEHWPLPPLGTGGEGTEFHTT